jgi:hypothetical protein
MQTYHDEEWGVPERDPRALWEMLMLEGFQPAWTPQPIAEPQFSQLLRDCRRTAMCCPQNAQHL